MLRTLVSEEIKKQPRLDESLIQRKIDSAVQTATSVGAFKPPVDLNSQILNIKVNDIEARVDQLTA